MALHGLADGILSLASEAKLAIAVRRKRRLWSGNRGAGYARQDRKQNRRRTLLSVVLVEAVLAGWAVLSGVDPLNIAAGIASLSVGTAIVVFRHPLTPDRDRRALPPAGTWPSGLPLRLLRTCRFASRRSLARFQFKLQGTSPQSVLIAVLQGAGVGIVSPRGSSPLSVLSVVITWLILSRSAAASWSRPAVGATGRRGVGPLTATIGSALTVQLRGVNGSLCRC